MSSEGNIALAGIHDTLSIDYDRTSNGDITRRSFDNTNEQEQLTLPRADGGLQAWAFLLASFFIEALVWGLPFSFGIFQEHYETHPPFSNEPDGITVIGTSALGVMYLSAPLVSIALQSLPHQRRYFGPVGFILITVALISASFAHRVWQLILTQGVLYALGGSLLYFPTIVYLDEWFIRRKGLGFGIMWAGTGASGICIPFVMNWGLNTYGFRTMFRVWAVAMLILSGPLMFFIKPRVPVARGSSRRRPLNYAFVWTRTFWLLQIANILEGLGFFIPNIYLPTYAVSLGLSKFAGATTVFLFNATSVIGTIIVGSLTDRFEVTALMLVSTIGAALSCFFLWGFATSLPLLCVFSLTYGLTAGGFSSTWTGMTQEIKKLDDGFETSLIFGLWAAGRGIGSVVSGPLSEALVSKKPWMGQAASGYGSGYGLLIVFTGISAALGSTGWIGRRVGWI